MLSHAAGPILAEGLAGCVPPDTSGACVIGVASKASGAIVSPQLLPWQPLLVLPLATCLACSTSRKHS